MHRVLDRLYEPDERNWPVRPLLNTTGATLRSRGWPCALRLDQGREGACVGYARAHDLAAWPGVAKGVTDQVAADIYYRARRLDPWPGEDYDGTSVLAGVKAARELGYVGEFRWARSIDDLLLALATIGPVVMGTDWLDSMYDPGPGGLLDVSGRPVGGHSYLARGVLLAKATIRRRLGPAVPLRDEPLVYGPNSWGRGWGRDGEWAMWASDLERLLTGVAYPGEGCISTRAFRLT